MKNTDKSKNDIRFDLLSILIILIAVLVFFRDLIAGQVVGTNDYGGNDLLMLHAPTLYHYGQALKDGVLLQWLPHIFCGFPVFAEGQNGFLYPFNLVVYYLFDLITALNIHHIFHSFLMGIGTFYFIKKATGNSYAALPGAVAAALCGSLVMGHTRHLGIYAIISLSPFLFLLIEKYLQNKNFKYALLFGPLIGILALIGHPQFSFITVFLSLSYFVLRLIFIRNKSDEVTVRPSLKSIFIFLGTSFFLSLLIALPQLMATYELYTFTERAGDLSDSFREMGSIPYGGFMTFIYPYYWGNAGNHTFHLNNIFYFWEWFHYAGLVTFLLAITGVIFNWKNSGAVKALVILGVFCYLLALGENLPVYKIFSFIPAVNNFRFPNRWLVGTEITIIFLSGFGIKAMIELIKNKSGRKISAFISLLAAIVVFLDIFLIVGLRFKTIEPEIYFRDSGSVNYMKKEDDFFRYYSFNYSRSIALAFEMSKGWENDQRFYRMVTNSLPANIGAYHDIYQASSNNLGLIPGYLARLWGSPNTPGIIPSLIKTEDFIASPRPAFMKAMRLYGVRYISTVFQIKGLDIVWDSSAVAIHEIIDPRPRAWVADKLLVGPTKYFMSVLSDPSFDIASMAQFPYKNQRLPQFSRSGKIAIEESDYHRLVMRAENPGLAVISDTWHPRWKAKVNGKETRVFRVNHSMRGFFINKPNSHIEMYYYYDDIIILSILSYSFMFISLLLFVLLVIKNKRKEKNV